MFSKLLAPDIALDAILFATFPINFVAGPTIPVCAFFISLESSS